MPIYEYECPECGIVEVWQGISEQPLKRCPRCKRRKAKKLISDTSFRLKGTGWYVTDYARNNGGDGKDKDEKKKSPEKPAPKKDAKTSETTTSSSSSTSTS